ncbi:MAG: hypothetical protein EBU96_12645 [Actinobacteria bacterium]|nr:hypothetical protein [Actinomycetota bacterium]
MLKLLATTGTATGLTVTQASKFYLIAYDAGNAYLYYVAEGNVDTLAAAAEITLLGVMSGVADGALGAANLDLIP